jgi:hypothetical protein
LKQIFNHRYFDGWRHRAINELFHRSFDFRRENPVFIASRLSQCDQSFDWRADVAVRRFQVSHLRKFFFRRFTRNCRSNRLTYKYLSDVNKAILLRSLKLVQPWANPSSRDGVEIDSRRETDALWRDPSHLGAAVRRLRVLSDNAAAPRIRSGAYADHLDDDGKARARPSRSRAPPL